MKNLLAAFAKAQAGFDTVRKDATNPAFKSRYATLGSVQESIEPALVLNGLVVMQSVRTDFSANGPIIYVRADLWHIESGETTFIELGLMPVKLDPQGMGSAITYGRRYVLMTMFGLVGEDDDGNQASGYKAPAPAGQTRKQPTPVNGIAPYPTYLSWTKSADATAWAVTAGRYASLDDAAEDFGPFYRSRVAEPKKPTDAEKKAVFAAWYEYVTGAK